MRPDLNRYLWKETVMGKKRARSPAVTAEFLDHLRHSTWIDDKILYVEPDDDEPDSNKFGIYSAVDEDDGMWSVVYDMRPPVSAGSRFWRRLRMRESDYRLLLTATASKDGSFEVGGVTYRLMNRNDYAVAEPSPSN